MKQILTGLILLALSIPSLALGYEIEKNPSLPVENGFIVGPAKIETEIAEGGVKTVLVNVENRTGRSQTFRISFDDFTAGNQDVEAVRIGADEANKSSLKNFLYVEKKEFVLNHGDRLLLPVTITIPAGTPAGTKLGAVLVSSEKMSDRITDDARAYSAANVVGQIATLLFVNVPGEVKVQGKLEGIKTKNNTRVFFLTPISLQILYRNSGEIYLNPYGKIDVKNMFGRQVSSYILDPWFTLPNSLRTREISLSKGLTFGRYSAHALVNRGYENIVDEMEVSFYVVPPMSLLLLIVVVILLVIVSRRTKRI
ncbi:MAG: hypothetical protein A2741_00615 [Candidatus Zambryskibacteria bacterium RIFCSPHIGHO2_01_FULL_43_27]|uniref:DUF3324 domain-containing protein n=1 Tax=Candidatus Zambryskibacteria bacterium RIFCSPLOWO2_01_FULL_43_17 TaxID=1802760 RepID=A0A1G2U5B9_9BACT|nr:MAG: hypothetical protein A2741_00615 [Candidatus Zambryskibacteria bacterium RIFCSPHIGHO2_01_FULL_43_27]OHA99643.1 MAG: hypothetical protein A3E93_00735 [Candidatus Zambryskibacteria bacterium RIFCSPHIGHO2_12_FULL_43_12b]OHB04130.1 MAG: hypothetical protein A2920_02210 [Candidatus Zambryskibacteria bacterium RIFCSPLOWO2_01_FULL_43_17]